MGWVSEWAYGRFFTLHFYMEKRMRKKWIAVWGGILCIFLFLLGGCGLKEEGNANRDDEGEPVTIRFAWWGEENRNERTRDAVGLFMEKNPDIIVQTVSYPFETYGENMDIFVQTGYMPDVWQGYVGADNDYMQKGLVEPLDPWVEQGLIDIGDISPGLLETGIIDGKLYGLSLGCNVKCMVVIPGAFEDAGMKIPENGYPSWEALEEALLKVKGEREGAVAGHIFNRDFLFEYFCLQRGERKFQEGEITKIGFSEKTYVDYYRMWMRWEEEGIVPSYMETYQVRMGYSDAVEKTDYAADTIYSNQFEERAAKSGEEMKLIPLPGTEEMGGMEIRPGTHICMSSLSEQKEAAARLIDFLINDLDANRILNAERGMPASSVVRDELFQGFSETQREMAEIIRYAEKNSISAGPVSASDHKALDDGAQGGLMEELEQQIMLRQIEPEEAYDILSEQFGEN